MDLTILSALLFCWIGGMVMGAAITYGIRRQQDPKPDLTVEAEEITADLEEREQQQGNMEFIPKGVVLDMLDEVSAEIEQGWGFRYAEWRKFICDLKGMKIGRWNDSYRG